MDLSPNSDLNAPDIDAEVPDRKVISLGSEELSSLGIADCVPGETYNIRLKYQGESGADPEKPKDFEILSSTTETNDSDKDEGAPAEEDAVKPPEDEDEKTPEEKTLGYRRSTKAPRSGLPPTLGMRSL